MPAPNETNPCPGARLRPICLIRSGERWVASPAKGECSAGRGFAPFVLPPPPRSQIDWLAVAGQRVWQEKRRCMLALRLVDCRTAHWTLRLPAQRCRAGSAALDAAAAAEGIPHVPSSLRLAGSFQTVADTGNADDGVPVWPGLHFAMTVNITRPLLAAVRQNGRLIPAEPCTLMTNDWTEAIDRAAARLRLA
ncbi:MAG TPA: hypothetical protein VGI81_07685 [Tepidisphaeraceae bacterium]|jgi:hypothetical protein